MKIGEKIKFRYHWDLPEIVREGTIEDRTWFTDDKDAWTFFAVLIPRDGSAEASAIIIAEREREGEPLTYVTSSGDPIILL